MPVTAPSSAAGAAAAPAASTSAPAAAPDAPTERRQEEEDQESFLELLNNPDVEGFCRAKSASDAGAAWPLPPPPAHPRHQP